MSSSRDPTRLRLGLNPLTTQLGHFNAQHGAPLSAISMASSHMTPHMTPTQTPASAIQPYNPQEWVASPVVERQSQYVGEPQGETASFSSPVILFQLWSILCTETWKRVTIAATAIQSPEKPATETLELRLRPACIDAVPACA
jgi:hypothetical protein